tara:strand:- start:943 stop:1404 length:462 start_codon:yes stop_codon:yes gene_type:complete
MNWGAIIGAVAVPSTFAYLADQIKQDTKAVKAATQQAISDATTEVWRNLCIDIDRTEKFYEISEKDDRSKAEQSFYVGWLMQTIRQQENIYLNPKLGSIQDGFVDLNLRLVTLFKSPIYKKAWLNGELNNFLFTEFRDYVDDLIGAELSLVKE